MGGKKRTRRDELCGNDENPFSLLSRVETCMGVRAYVRRYVRVRACVGVCACTIASM